MGASLIEDDYTRGPASRVTDVTRRWLVEGRLPERIK